MARTYEVYLRVEKYFTSERSLKVKHFVMRIKMFVCNLRQSLSVLTFFR